MRPAKTLSKQSFIYFQQKYQLLMLFSMHFWPKIVNSYGSRLNSFSLDPSSGPMRPPEPFFWLYAARGLFKLWQCGPQASLSLRPLM